MEFFIKEGNRKCLECKQRINLSKDKFVLLATCNMLNPKHKEDYAFFHFSCWKNYFDKRVLNKASNHVKMMQDHALMIFENPMMQKVLKSAGVTNVLEPMLNKEIPIMNLDYLNKSGKKDGKRKKKKN